MIAISYRVYVYINCAEAQLGGKDMSTLVFPRAAIACFDCHWQYVMSRSCERSYKLAAYKPHGNKSSCIKLLP